MRLHFMEINKDFTTQPLSLASEESPVIYTESTQSTCLREAAPAKAGEIRISKQIPMTKAQSSKQKSSLLATLENVNFYFVSSFDIRISNFLMGNMEAGGPNDRTYPRSCPT